MNVSLFTYNIQITKNSFQNSKRFTIICLCCPIALKLAVFFNFSYHYANLSNGVALNSMIDNGNRKFNHFIRSTHTLTKKY